jgi:GT2 family glycosyltransferase
MNHVSPASEIKMQIPEPIPPASLIICTRNRPGLLADTIRSICDGLIIPAEIIVIDQSDQEHPNLVMQLADKGCSLRYVRVDWVGVARARNTGIALAQYELLAFTDDDMRAAPDWFSALMHALVMAGPRTVVTGQVREGAMETPGGFAPSTNTGQTPRVYEGRIGTDVLWTGNMALYRSAANGVGGFDERLGPGAAFPAAEDNDFGFRLLEAGYRIVYVPEAILYHRAWRSRRDYVRLQWNYGRGQGAYLAKYFSIRDRYMARRMMGSLINGCLRFARHALHLRRSAFGDAAYTAGLIAGAARWLLTQRGMDTGSNVLRLAKGRMKP